MAGGVTWQAFVPDSLLNRCRENTAVEDCREIIVAAA